MLAPWFLIPVGDGWVGWAKDPSSMFKSRPSISASIEKGKSPSWDAEVRSDAGDSEPTFAQELSGPSIFLLDLVGGPLPSFVLFSVGRKMRHWSDTIAWFIFLHNYICARGRTMVSINSIKTIGDISQVQPLQLVYFFSKERSSVRGGKRSFAAIETIVTTEKPCITLIHRLIFIRRISVGGPFFGSCDSFVKLSIAVHLSALCYE